jgi:hypothetical protein
MKTRLLTALAAATLALAGCKDSTGSKDIASGSLAFSYTGARSGTYSASGAIHPTASGFTKQPFASGVKLTNGGQNFVGIISYVPVTASTGHEVIIIFPSTAAGQNVPLSDNCVTSDCPLAIVAFETDPDLQEDNSDPFFFTAGTLHVTSVSSTRITGTFSGVAEDFDGTRTITITGGSFDVPLVDQSLIPAASRAVPTPAFMRQKGATLRK